LAAGSAPLPAYIGFASAAPRFWDALAGQRDGKISRDQAVADIAARLYQMGETFEEARKAA